MVCVWITPSVALTSKLQIANACLLSFRRFQVCVSVAGAGVLPDCHDKLIELVASSETDFLHLFSQQQLQVS